MFLMSEWLFDDRYDNTLVLVNKLTSVWSAEASAVAPVAAELPSARERGQPPLQLPLRFRRIRRSQPHAAHKRERQHHG